MGRQIKYLWLLAILAVVSVTLVAAGVIHSRGIHQGKENLERWANLFQHQLLSSPPSAVFDKQELQQLGFLLRAVEREEGVIRVLWENSEVPPVSALNLSLEGIRQHITTEHNDEKYLVMSVPVSKERGFVIVKPMTAVHADFLETMAWVFAADLGLLLLFFILFRRIYQPLRNRLDRQSAQHSLSWEHMTGIALQLSDSRFLIDQNPRFRQMFGDTFDRQFEQLVEPDEIPRVIQYLQQALESNALIDFECTLIDRYGDHGRWAMHAKPWVSDGVANILLTGDDISKRHHMEQEIRTEQHRVTAYFNSMQTLLVICDRYGKIERINQQTQALLNMDEEQLINLPIRNLLPKSQAVRLLGLWRELLTSDQDMVSLECPMVSASGKESTISWRVTKMTDDESGRIEVVLAGLDITESVANRTALEVANRRIREALSQAEHANRSKSIFLANMSHEIRTPMNGILGAAELLLDTGLKDEQRNYLEIIHSSSHVLLDIINDILDLSKIESGNLEIEAIDFDLNRLLTDIYQLFNEPARRKGLALVYFYDSELPAIWRGDPKRIRQIITNLMSNALKFTDQGRIEIRVSGVKSAERSFDVRIGVADSGIGISQEKIEQIFSAFRQADTSTSRKYGGTGLGLTISRHLASAMSGDIVVNSDLGRGSCFCLELPLRVSEAELQPAVIPKASMVSNLHGHVLLAEDNHVNQRIAEKMLQRIGLKCTIVENGEQAVSAVLQHDYDMVLMDVNMPLLDGIAATERIRDLSYPKNQVPILALTANAMMEDKERCLKAGMNGFVSKPIKVAALTEAISTLLSKA